MSGLFDPQTFFWAFTAIFALGAAAAFLPTRSLAACWVSLLLGLAGSAYAVAGAAHYLRDPAPATALLVIRSLELYLPSLRLEVRVDPLSAFFLMLTGAFSAVVAVYSLAALRAEHFERQRRRVAAGFCVLVWSTLGAVVSNDGVSLIFMLEVGTLSFAFLALFKHNQHLDGTLRHADSPEGEKNARISAPVYLIVSHTSNVLLLLALLFLVSRAGDTGFSFDSLRAAANAARADASLVGGMGESVCFLLALAGLGIRAGLTPAHFWVPLVHPSSPTPTHALSLGIVIKIAVYLMYRFFFQFLTPVPWWGYLVLLLAVLTALVNVWFAITSHDLKTALAYHSVENVGIITAGLGVALIYGGPSGDRALAALALVASLYHVLNHAVFKGLLYLCTGAVDNLTRQVVEFEKLGGLVKDYKWTAAAFLVGTVAICGFPPFNGFASEWLTLRAMLGGIKGAHPSGVLVFVLCAVTLVAAFVLTAVCFVKIAGITMLGAPRLPAEERKGWGNLEEPLVERVEGLLRSALPLAAVRLFGSPKPPVRKRRDVPWAMRSMMLLLSSLCLLLGLFPGAVAGGLLHGIALSVLPGEVGPTPAPPELGILQQTVTSLAVFFLSLGLVVFAAATFAGRRRKVVVAKAPWNCGTSYAAETMQYTGAALTFLVRDQVGIVEGRADEQGKADYLPASITISRSPSFRQAIGEPFRRCYNRWADRLLRFSERVGGAVQNGDIRRYLFYIFAANLAALVLFLLTEMLRAG